MWLRVRWPSRGGPQMAEGKEGRLIIERKHRLTQVGEAVWEMEAVRVDRAAGEQENLRHVAAIGDAPAYFPIVPGASKCADAGASSVQRQALLEAPFPQRVERFVGHADRVSDFRTTLQSHVSGLAPVFVSAQIIPIRAMVDCPNRIRHFRTGRNWSQDALAAIVGCSKPQISDLERGNIQLTVDWMRRLARAFDISPADLLNAQDNPMSLSPFERDLILRLRHASPEQAQTLEKVADAIVPQLPRVEERAA